MVGTDAVSTAGLSLFVGFLPLLRFCLRISDGSSVCSACNDAGVKMEVNFLFGLSDSTSLWLIVLYLKVQHTTDTKET